MLEDEPVDDRRNMADSTCVLENERIMDVPEENGNEEDSKKKQMEEKEYTSVCSSLVGNDRKEAVVDD